MGWKPLGKADASGLRGGQEAVRREVVATDEVGEGFPGGGGDSGARQAGPWGMVRTLPSVPVGEITKGSTGCREQTERVQGQFLGGGCCSDTGQQGWI